ncbi:MAG: hypothetical protein Q9160_000159 [Pyrenula sp. 1 TL-2023]
MASNLTSKQRLAHAILHFLSTSTTDGTLPSEDQLEQIEIARNCISDAFQVQLDDTAAISDAVGDQSLLSIYSVYEKLKGKSTATTPDGKSSAESGRPTSPIVPPSTKPATPAAVNPEAEKLKSAGNDAMKSKDYTTAIAKYSSAITLSPANPIYLSNRAAAYSAQGNHAQAAGDAEIAVAADPKYSKGWSRLGLAKFALGDARGAAEAYAKGIESEGGAGSDAMRKGLETAQKRVKEMEKEEKEELPDQEIDDAPTAGAAGGGAGGGMPDLAGLASMFGGGGRGGGGGMPDLGSLMNNPMLAGLAQNLMQDPEKMRNLMNNPQVQSLMGGMGGGGGGGAGRGENGGGGGGGGGMPDFSAMMNDPRMREMAQNFMGGGMGRGGAGRGGQ